VKGKLNSAPNENFGGKSEKLEPEDGLALNCKVD